MKRRRLRPADFRQADRHLAASDPVLKELIRCHGPCRLGHSHREDAFVAILMFRLQRPDVLPVGDLGIVNAIKQAYRLLKSPTPSRMEKIAEPWRPYRSIACWYLWRSMETVTPGAADPSD